MVYPIWERLKAGNRYVYTQVNRKHQPIQFDSNTGTFRVYTSPDTSSYSFDTYITPEQFNNNKSNTVNDNNPVQLKEVQITAKKPTEFVGIQRTPDDHQAALARDRAVDAKVNPQNDQLQSFFANLMTGGMYSAVDQGAKNLAKGNYLEGAAQTATPIMFGPAKSAVANLTRLGVGAYDLLSKNGVQKTYNLAKQGNWLGAAKSAAGDALNLGMAIGGGYNLGKYNIPAAINYAAKNGNNVARSYLINKELNQNVRNFDGTVGEEYFWNPVPYRWIRMTETPEVHGLQEIGKNVTTIDAHKIHVPTNDWRMAHIKDFIFKDGQWYQRPKHKFNFTKFGAAHGNTSQASYGIAWNGTTAQSRQFPSVRLEGEAYNELYRGFDPNTGYDSRTHFVLQNADDIPMGSRLGFHTGEMPMENLQYFQQLPNGRWAIKGQVLPNKNLYIDTPIATEPTGNTSLKFFERPNKLSFRERMGLSKGSYNDLDKYQKDALNDLESFYTNGQYRNKFVYNPNTDKFEFTNILSDGKTSGLKKIVDAGNYHATDYYIRSGDGQLSYFYTLHNGSINLIPDGQTFGEMSARPLTTYSKQIILTSPKVDMLDTNPDLVKEASKLPDKIDKKSMSRFWDGVQQTTKPGTYLSGDNGVAPLGYKLITSYTDKNLSQAAKDLLANDYDISSIVDRSGLSPDSYYSIVRQGLRPEHSLRFSRNGFTKLNDSAIDNKDLYQMWKSATTPEAKQQFVSTWNSRIYPNSSFINNRGQIEFLHPFVFYKKFGGKLNNNGKN